MSSEAASEDSRDLFGETLAPARRGRQLPLPLGWRKGVSALLEVRRQECLLHGEVRLWRLGLGADRSVCFTAT